MPRADAFFTVKTPFQGPRARASSLNCLAAEQWPLLAETRNVVRIDLDTADTEPRSQAVTLAWRYGTEDTLLQDWTIGTAPDEEAYVSTARTTLQTELEELEAKIAAVQPPNSPSTADLNRLADLTRELENLSAYRYWQEVSNPFGDGAKALYRSCNAPNIPFRLRSNWRLEPDRPFSIWFHRCKPHEAQADSRLRIRFGHWCLEFCQEREVRLYRYKDGREWVPADGDTPGHWVTYRGTNWSEIDAIEAQIAALQDGKHLNASDRQRIAGWQAEIAALDQQIHALTADRTLTTEQRAGQKTDLRNQIGVLREQIKTLKDSKRAVTVADEDETQALEASYLREVADVQFAHMAESLIGQDVVITVIPQPRGYLVLHCSQGKDYWVFEDTEVTAANTEATVVSATPLEISGNGGALWFRFAYIQPENSGHLLSAVLATSAPARGSRKLTIQATQPRGTGVQGTVVDLGGTSYQWRVDLTSTEGYLPFLYRLRLDLGATPRDRDAETLVLDSRTAGYLWDAGSSYDKENRGRAATLIMWVPDADVAAVTALANCQVQLWESEAAPWFTGILADPTITPEAKNCQRVEFRCLDRWALLRSDRMAGEPAGDGKWLGDYLREVAAGLGLWSDEIIVSGPVLTRRLPQTAPNRALALEPAFGVSRADWLTQLYEDFCYFYDMWFDGRGRLHVEPLGMVTKPIAFRAMASGSGDRRVMAGLTRTDSWEHFRNDLTVLGAALPGYNAGTEQVPRLSARYQDYSSVNDPTCQQYVGRWIPDEPYQSDSLTTQALVNACLRWRVYRYLLPYTELEFSCGYDPTLEVGDRVTAGGLTVEVVEVRADSRAEDRMTVKARVI